MTASLASANEISMDAAVAAVVSELDGILAQKSKEQHWKLLCFVFLLFFFLNGPPSVNCFL